MGDGLLELQNEALGLTLLEAVLESVPDATILIDQSGIIHAFSRSAEALFGHAAKDVIGENVSIIMAGADLAFHDRYISNYLSSGEKQIIGKGRIVEACLADGTIIPVHLTIGEARVGESRMFAGYVRDLTDKQAADHRLSTLQAELAGFSRLSTVGTMASAMAHELNQPLTAVANYLEAARDMLTAADSQTLPVVRDALDAAAKQSVRAGQIVRKLRDYVSRGEFEKTTVDINALIEEAIPLAKLGIDGRVPRFLFDADASLPPVFADRLQIRQVLLNLLKNAAEALVQSEDPTISVRAWAKSDDTVLVEVADNGPGLGLEEGRSPFEPFQSSKSDGMGLGLSICQTIIEAHDGEIWLADEIGQGAAFRFSLMTAE